MRVLPLIAVILASSASVASAPDQSIASIQPDVERTCGPAGSPYMRTTLYFGLTRPTGTVSETEWQKFLREDVTRASPTG